MTVAAYIRVSSRSQNLATQRDAISKAARARGDRITVWWQETRTAAKLARPELDRLRKHVAAGDIKKLYVFRIDRLTRSGIRDTLSVLEELRAGGCKVISLEGRGSLGAAEPRVERRSGEDAEKGARRHVDPRDFDGPQGPQVDGCRGAVRERCLFRCHWCGKKAREKENPCPLTSHCPGRKLPGHAAHRK